MIDYQNGDYYTKESGGRYYFYEFYTETEDVPLPLGSVDEECREAAELIVDGLAYREIIKENES